MLSHYVNLLLNQAISSAGHFTPKDRIQIIAVPTMVASKDLTTPAPVIIYTAPEHPLNAPVDNDSKGWETEVPFPRHICAYTRGYWYASAYNAS